MKKIFAVMVITSVFLVGCTNSRTYDYRRQEVACGKVVKQYYTNKDSMDLDHAVEYDKSANSYDIAIFGKKFDSKFSPIYIYYASEKFAQKHFPDEFK